MANTRSATKRIRQSEKRRVRNAAARSTVRTAVKQARTTLASEPPDAARVAVAATVRALDRAVTKGVLHKNAAARKKSRLTRQLNARAAQGSST